MDGDTVKFFLDGSNVIADYDGSDVLQATYVTPGLDANLSQTRGGSTYYYMADGLGSIRNLVDANEDTQNVYDYYAFGKELGSWTQNVTNRYTYTAREYDTESEQYYYRARYYDGGGRFSSRDPQREHPNCYSYVNGRPVMAKDPSGEKLWHIGNLLRAMYPPFSWSQPLKVKGAVYQWTRTQAPKKNKWIYANLSFPTDVQSSTNGFGITDQVLCIMKKKVVNWYMSACGVKSAPDTGIGWKVVPWKPIGGGSDYGHAKTHQLPIPIPLPSPGNPQILMTDTFWEWVGDDSWNANNSCRSDLHGVVQPNPPIGLDLTGSGTP